MQGGCAEGVPQISRGFLRFQEGWGCSGFLELGDPGLERGTSDFAARDPKFPVDLGVIVTLPVYG